jgi:hypothetical protein
VSTPTAAERDALLAALEAMPEFLADRLGSLAPEVARRAGRDGTFSPTEHCWHLADLEREGYAVRIRRLLTEEEPFLPDFDGARVAEERQYREKSLQEGLDAFRRARLANVAVLRSVQSAQWSRPGIQDGVGRLTLGDVPRMMYEHDATHRNEIVEWAR